MLAALLSSASLQEEKKGLQKDALSDGSSTKSTLYQDEWETIPINMFWIQKKKKKQNRMLDNTSIGLSDRKCCELFANVNSFTIHTGKKICMPVQEMQEKRVGPLGGEDSLQKEMATHSSILPGEFHGQRSRVDYSPWDCRDGHI